MIVSDPKAYSHKMTFYELLGVKYASAYSQS